MKSIFLLSVFSSFLFSQNQPRYNLPVCQGNVKTNCILNTDKTGAVTLPGNVNALGNVNVGSTVICPAPVTMSGATLTLTTAHNGCVVNSTGGGTATVTVPSGLPVGFTATIVQIGNGTVSPLPSGTTFLSSASTTGIGTSITFLSTSTNSYVMFESGTVASLQSVSYLTCDMKAGDLSAPVTNMQLTSVINLCYIPFNATIVEVDISANDGTPSVLTGIRRTGASFPITSAPITTEASGGRVCSRNAVGPGIDATLTCLGNLINANLLAGDYLELRSGTAGGVAALVTAHVIYQTPPTPAQNLLTYSEDITNSAWSTTTGLAKTSTGLYTVSASGVNNLFQDVTVVPGQSYVFGFDAKLGTLTTPKYAIYDSTNGAFVVSSTSFAGSVDNVGYARILVSFTAPAGCVAARTYLSSNSSATGDMYVKRMQLSTGTFEKTYVTILGTPVQ